MHILYGMTMEKANYVIDQIEEALEERQGKDRRQTSADAIIGLDRRQQDRRDKAIGNSHNKSLEH